MTSETIEYASDGTTCEGYLAYDGTHAERRPGILVVPAWNGVNDYARKRADMLAGMGYVALVADIYGKGVRPQGFDEAAREAGKYRGDRPLFRTRVAAGLAALRKAPAADPARLAAIGYCFGGQAVLELARGGADVKGVVSFHGALDSPTPEDARNIKARVLVLHGADDPLVPEKNVLAFEAEMRAAGVDWQLVAYGGAVHSFTDWTAGNDPSRGVAYNEKADRRSWVAMRAFLDELFA